MKKVTRKVGKYEVGRTIGKGTYAKVKYATNTETGESVAMKVLAKSTILRPGMVEQIRREMSIMKIARHPNIVRLHEVLSSNTKIYIIYEFVTGGELFEKNIGLQGKIPEHECRRYFQQLIDAVAHCHSKGVYHRDLKLENLLLDSYGNLKVSDFGLSALPQQGGLLHTTCGTPNYVAPEALGNQCYDGAAADVWSCGVILYVIMAGYLPFDGKDLPSLCRKRLQIRFVCQQCIRKSIGPIHSMLYNSRLCFAPYHINAAQFSCPFWFSPGANSLIRKILDPNPTTRIHIEGIRKHPWFRKNYAPVEHREDEEVNLDDDQYVAEQSESSEGRPLIMNAFEMITLSQGLNLCALFDRRQDYVKRQTRFFSRKPADAIISNVEAVAESMSLKVHSRGYKTRLERISANQTGQFAVVLEVYKVAPFLFMVDVQKAAGDTLEYHKFYKNLCTKLENIIWKPTEGYG